MLYYTFSFFLLLLLLRSFHVRYEGSGIKAAVW